ncbi:peptide/nickel transport system substrate-binding protein [Neorhizobium galegae]|uniref:ABC transporter substrate-binding protein n=1 Tax=Neorhizobium galegae TaxID=399 RepID=UPI001AE45158|nr:ABC transporter substrate-binding protein [Neorhizobium galegae]MBP2562084.1 peptide/nickel transport system substrate-binding protein [Neorhizobium galegae]MDQ0133933.1 peptide/nickel transport system substrate-binding protein [Neorhizobium galegae]
MKFSSRSWLSAAFLAGATLLAAVSPARVSAAAEDKTLIVRFYDDPAGFDPSNIFRIENENIAFNIFSGLTTYDSKTGQIVPDLATSWETKDNVTWTFHLRKGVQWQKGYGEFTAADVLYSYKRVLDPATASPYVSELTGIDTMEAPDPYTVVIKLKAANGGFLHTVANYHQGQIVKKEAIEAAGGQVRWKPVGTGPYYLDSIDVNSRIVLKRHDGYYKGPAPIATLDFHIIKDDATAAIALRNGEIDLLMRQSKEEQLQILKDAGFKMNHVDNYASSIKVMNLSDPILKDVRVRRAIAYAIDYPAITAAIAPTLQAPAYSMLMPWMDVFSKDAPEYKYDPEKAKKLLAEAGYPNGFTLKSLNTSAQGVTEQQQFEIDYLSQVGIKMELELVDTPTFNQRRNKGDFMTATRLLPAVNPDMILFSYLHPDNIAPKGLNGARYNNPELTSAIEAARAEADPEKRMGLYAKAQKIAMTDLPYIPALANNVYWPSKPNVTGVNINYLAQVNFWEVDK